jgi:hypothetical protein
MKACALKSPAAPLFDYAQGMLFPKKGHVADAVAASPEHPVLIDKFLDDAIEVDVPRNRPSMLRPMSSGNSQS